MEFLVLGPIEVREEDRVIPLGGAKQRALLAALLLHANEVVSRDRLIDGLWGEQPPATATHTVETYVSRLRRALHDAENHDVLVTRPPGYLVRIDREELDLKRFERLAWEGRQALTEGNPRDGGELLRQALALFRGPPLNDVAFFPFAQVEVDRLEQMRLAALEDRMEANLAVGRSAELVGELEALVNAYPLRERLWAQLMVALYRARRQADALEAYRRARQYLVEELGVDPSPTLRRLEQAILLHDVTLELSPGAESLVTGTHPFFESTAVVKPAPPIPPGVNANLPRPASSFVGREREVREVASLLREGPRLLTLSGPGGSGKTRLAIEAAFGLASDYQDGVFWVGLGPLRDPALVTETVGQTLGASLGPAAHIGEREMLLLLDNFEHVVEAAPELSALLEACPNLKLLVTSREVLRIQGEVEYPVPPLRDADAVKLFCARSRLAPHNDIAELCRRLDNLPLGIELAAARTSVLTPAEILERISKRLDLFKGTRDAEDRHRNLRATIEWSYHLLNEMEKALFARLSVFAGGCTLRSAEEVADADLDVLQSLVDKSLVRHSGDRFWMLETIRGYGAERLDEVAGGAGDLGRRHAEHFLKLAEGAPGLGTSSALSANVADTSVWRDQIQADYDNVRAALSWFREAGDLEREFRLVFPVTWLFLWVHRGGMREAGRMYEGILSKGDQLSPEMRVDALHSLAHFGTYLDREARRRLAERSLSLARALGDKGRIEWSLRRLALRQADRQDARRLLLECETLARELHEEARLAWIQQALGVIALAHDDYTDARRRLEESVSIFQRIGGKWQAAYALSSLAALAVLQKRYEDARPLLVEALRRALDLRMPNHAAQSLDNVAALVLAQGDAELAVRLLAAADAVREETGDQTTEGEDWFEYEIQMRAQTTAAARKRLGRGFAGEWTAGSSLTLNEAVGLALDSLLSSAATR
jgi:predicted ATPase/DNA-binding SARP family transcriptional activator